MASDQWHSVQPLQRCPHTDAYTPPAELLQKLAANVRDLACEACGEAGEVMACLGCGAVNCGRHVRGHATEHHRATGHPLTLGVIDASIWCYECEDYITHANPHVRSVHQAHMASIEDGSVADIVAAASHI